MTVPQGWSLTVSFPVSSPLNRSVPASLRPGWTKSSRSAPVSNPLTSKVEESRVSAEVLKGVERVDLDSADEGRSSGPTIVPGPSGRDRPGDRQSSPSFPRVDLDKDMLVDDSQLNG